MSIARMKKDRTPPTARNGRLRAPGRVIRLSKSLFNRRYFKLSSMNATNCDFDTAPTLVASRLP